MGIQTAISKHVCRWAFMGDSITLGDDLSSYGLSYPGLLQSHIEREFDNCWHTFGNFSISGRGIGEAQDAAYVGGTTHVPGVTFYYPDNAPRWPGGSVIGKSWKQHVIDFAPDVIFIALGANPGPAGDDVSFKRVAGYLIDDFKAALSNVNIVLITPITPGVGAAPPAFVDAMAVRLRELASERGLSLIDANALAKAKIAQGYTSSDLLVNNVNHPNAFASKVCYFAAFDAYLSSLKNPASGTGVAASGYSSDSSISINSGDYIDVLINGAGAAAALLPGSNFFKLDVTGASANITLRKSSTSGGAPVVVTQHTITFPHSGNWLVAAFATSTTVGGHKSHGLMSLAWKR